MIGIGLGILATRSSAGNLNTVFRADLIASTFVFSTPLDLRRASAACSPSAAAS